MGPRHLAAEHARVAGAVLNLTEAHTLLIDRRVAATPDGIADIALKQVRVLDDVDPNLRVLFARSPYAV